MIKNWIIATYKINEIKRVESNLLNQEFDYYLPKITIKKTKSNSKVEVLFPGYIFINTSLENYSVLKYTKGIKNIIKFGEHISYLTDEEIKKIRNIEETSKLKPIISKIRIGQEALVAKGSFRGMVVKICSLPSKKRVDILLYFLGSKRRTSISEKDLIF
tara:strand:+ start:201 stop:680 length:480 start_codon:yes stop_codon:yes gene_type:complete